MNNKLMPANLALSALIKTIGLISNEPKERKTATFVCSQTGPDPLATDTDPQQAE